MSHLHLGKADLALTVKALDVFYGDGGAEYEHAKVLKTVLTHLSKGRNHLSVEFGRWGDDDQAHAPAPASVAQS